MAQEQRHVEVKFSDAFPLNESLTVRVNVDTKSLTFPPLVRAVWSRHPHIATTVLQRFAQLQLPGENVGFQEAQDLLALLTTRHAFAIDDLTQFMRRDWARLDAAVERFHSEEKRQSRLRSLDTTIRRHLEDLRLALDEYNGLRRRDTPDDLLDYQHQLDRIRVQVAGRPRDRYGNLASWFFDMHEDRQDKIRQDVRKELNRELFNDCLEEQEGLIPDLWRMVTEYSGPFQDGSPDTSQFLDVELNTSVSESEPAHLRPRWVKAKGRVVVDERAKPPALVARIEPDGHVRIDDHANPAFWLELIIPEEMMVKQPKVMPSKKKRKEPEEVQMEVL